MMPENIRPFTARKITPNTWVITGIGCDSYLLLGAEMAMLIDSGMSPLDLSAFCRTLTDLPFAGVINTHGHFDHTGGNGWFKKAYMHPLAVKDAKRPFGGDESQWRLDYEIETVEEGQILDLGSRRLEIIYDGAHSLGSIAILDLDNFILFTGDELDPGQVLCNMSGEPVPGQSVENHQKNMRKLKTRWDEFDIICPGHNGTPIDKSYINDFIIVDQMIMDGVPGREDISSPTLPFPRPDGCLRLNYLGAHVCYNVNSIFEDQLK